MSSFFPLFPVKACIGNYRFSAAKKMSLRSKLQLWKTYNIIIRTYYSTRITMIYKRPLYRDVHEKYIATRENYIFFDINSLTD